MAHPGKQSQQGTSAATAGNTGRPADQSQIDFELEFYSAVLERSPSYVDVLRQLSRLLTLKGRYSEGLLIDRRIVQLCHDDPLAHYNLACRFARLNRPESCLKALRRAIELGYRDFRYMREDRDLDSVRHDPRFRQLVREFESR